jgi:hypothetical protein
MGLARSYREKSLWTITHGKLVLLRFRKQNPSRSYVHGFTTHRFWDSICGGLLACALLPLGVSLPKGFSVLNAEVLSRS